MKKIFILFLILTLFTACSPRTNLEIVPAENGSGFQHFYIENGMVYIVGSVTVKNNSSETLAFALEAESQEDYENKLLSSPNLQGYAEDLNATQFSIGANETKTFPVIFVGEHGGGSQKANRLMPDVTILEQSGNEVSTPLPSEEANETTGISLENLVPIGDEQILKIESFLKAQFGEKDDMTGNTYRFEIVGQTTFEDETYYIGRWSWLVDANHYSLISEFVLNESLTKMYEGYYEDNTFQLYNRENLLK